MSFPKLFKLRFLLVDLYKTEVYLTSKLTWVDLENLPLSEYWG